MAVQLRFRAEPFAADGTVEPILKGVSLAKGGGGLASILSGWVRRGLQVVVGL